MHSNGLLHAVSMFLILRIHSIADSYFWTCSQYHIIEPEVKSITHLFDTGITCAIAYIKSNFFTPLPFG